MARFTSTPLTRRLNLTVLTALTALLVPIFAMSVVDASPSLDCPPQRSNAHM